MYSGNDQEDRVAVVQLNTELRRAELELLSAECATDRLRLRFSVQDIAHFAKREILRKAIDLAGSLHGYYSSLRKQMPVDDPEETAFLPARTNVNAVAAPLARAPSGGPTDINYSIVTKAT